MLFKLQNYACMLLCLILAEIMTLHVSELNFQHLSYNWVFLFVISVDSEGAALLKTTKFSQWCLSYQEKCKESNLNCAYTFLFIFKYIYLKEELKWGENVLRRDFSRFSEDFRLILWHFLQFHS
jgi:hypothetical protein